MHYESLHKANVVQMYMISGSYIMVHMICCAGHNWCLDILNYVCVIQIGWKFLHISQDHHEHFSQISTVH